MQRPHGVKSQHLSAKSINGSATTEKLKSRNKMRRRALAEPMLQPITVNGAVGAMATVSTIGLIILSGVQQNFCIDRVATRVTGGKSVAEASVAETVRTVGAYLLMQATGSSGHERASADVDRRYH